MPDDEAERRSAAGIPTPDATPDEQWRRTVGGVYGWTEAEGGGGSPGVAPALAGGLGLGLFSGFLDG